MAVDINDMAPMSGRMLMEDGTVLNIADFLQWFITFAAPGIPMRYIQPAPPDPGMANPGDFWVDVSGPPVVNCWNGAAWVPIA